MEYVIALNFDHYFWSLYTIAAILAISGLEWWICFKLLGEKQGGVKWGIVFLLANLVSFYGEYYLFQYLNDGSWLLAWIPWHKIMDEQYWSDYLLSFPILFLVTTFLESLILVFFLTNKNSWQRALTSIVMTNAASTLLLIGIVNGALFNVLEGQENKAYIHLSPRLDLPFKE